jgi:hypothetical protein
MQELLQYLKRLEARFYLRISCTMSPFGTSRKLRDVRVKSAMRAKADMGPQITVAIVRRVTHGLKRAPSAQSFYRATLITGIGTKAGLVAR